VHRYEPRTLILREGLCWTSEAPFMYLLVGAQRALLIDTGDVADPRRLDLARSVQQLLPELPSSGGKPPLLVVHTHRHQDHRAGDAQLRGLPGAEVVGYDLESVKHYYKLPDWPQGIGHIDLGERALDVIATPGHDDTGVTFYDRGTGLVITGDFLLPGRVVVDDTDAYRDSVVRLSRWLSNRPVTAFLGGHIEMDGEGRLFPPGSTYHPGERPLPMSGADLEALSQGLARFNGFYTRSSGFTLQNSLHILMLVLLGGALLLAGLAWGVVSVLARRRTRQLAGQPG
jgi:glyoxylase-like metal-dependent hydrolase (beta-lactamase superfamily II)